MSKFQLLSLLFANLFSFLAVVGVVNLLVTLLVDLVRSRKKWAKKDLGRLGIMFGMMCLSQLFLIGIFLGSMGLASKYVNLLMALSWLIYWPGAYAHVLMPDFVNSNWYMVLVVVVEILWLGLLITTLMIVVKQILRDKFKVLNQVVTVNMLFLNIVGMAVLVSVFLTSLWVSEYCGSRQHRFHIFNAHLKDVCSEEKWKEQCPRSLNDLRNFDPPHFDELSECTQMHYYVDDLGQGTFIVKYGSRVFVSDGRLYDRWGLFSLSEFRNSEVYDDSVSWWE